MIEVINNKVFHLYNEKISYLFYRLKNDQLGHLYYGSRIHNLDRHNIEYLIKKDNKAAGTVKYGIEDRKFTLADTMQEYPIFGTSDYKDGGITLYDDQTPIYPDFVFESYEIKDGKKRISGFPCSYGSDSKILVITLVEKHYNIVLKQYYTIFNDSAIVVRNQKIINQGNRKIVIHGVMSTVLDLPSADFDFIHLSGAWLKERHIKKHSLSQGKVCVDSLRGASSHHQNPFVALQKKDATLLKGEVYGFNLIYSGNFLAQVEVDEWDNSRVMLGINPKYFTWTLNNGDVFKTPEALMGYSESGMNGLSLEFSNFIENHIIDIKWKKTKRPIVFNSWEAAYFDYDHYRLLELAKIVKELGMECFVIDDGWFGNRNNDQSSLGDWYVNQTKFPNGLKGFAKDIENLGLDLGIWFEPEMISPDSKLYHDHPEWVVGHLAPRKAIARNQYVLDFSDPEVIDNVFNQMKKIIEEANVKYIKWDMNRNITEAYSNYLQQKNIDQTEFFHRYILGLYDLYERITSNFPNILIEGCAGGGGRYDLGILYYSPQIWVSDDSDAIERLKIQFGTAMAYPLSSLSNHVSVVPNHQTGRIVPLQTRYNVAMFGSLGYELDLDKLNDNERKIIKEQIIDYKKYRNLILNGDFYKIISPFEQDQNEVAWAIINEDKSEAIVGIYYILTKPNNKPYEYIRLPFLNDDKYYCINNEDVISGELIKKIGLKKPYQFNGANEIMAQLKGDFQSWIFYIKEVNKER